MKKLQIAFLLLFLIIIQQSVAAQSQSEIELKISNAEILISEMSEEGFNTLRLNDILDSAKIGFDSQNLIPDKDKRDYALVNQYLEEIFEISQQGYAAKDEVDYTKNFYNEVLESLDDSSSLQEVKIKYDEMIFEFESERYEEANDLAKETYAELINLEGEQTALKLALKTTTQSIKNFLINNWLIILGGLLILLLAFVIFKNRIQYLLTQNKINKLNKELEVLKNLMKKTQKDYFEKGKIPESTYRVRIKKFSELVRDINRQIPLLNEELAKALEKQNKNKKTKKRKTKKK